MSIIKELFEILPDGRKVYAYTLKNANRMSVEILDFGGTIRRLIVEDRNGNFSDVIGGYDSIDSYINGGGHHGALIGRFGNRIAKGRFELDGVKYTLACNNGENHLHGGNVGFDRRIWDVDAVDGAEPKLILKLTSPDGEEGYPGTLKVTVTYTLTADNALSINYRAETDKSTPINMTNHAYFNLAGYANETVLYHELRLDADTYLPTDAGLIPTGELRSVEGTPFDFRVAKKIGADISADDADIKNGGGYDHNFNFVGGERGIELRGELYEPTSGRFMQMYTDQPCVQIYVTNNVGKPGYPQKNGFNRPMRSFVCLETQKMPDSINRPEFTDCVLRPGEIYDYTTIYKFSVK